MRTLRSLPGPPAALHPPLPPDDGRFILTPLPPLAGGAPDDLDPTDEVKGGPLELIPGCERNVCCPAGVALALELDEGG